jgi:long-chain acyl-CoA synthetase
MSQPMLTPTGLPSWWQHPPSLQRFVRDLLEAEMSLMRPNGWPLPGRGGPWPSDTSITHDLGADSLELLNLTVALADATSIREAHAAASLHELPTLGQWLALAHQGLDAQATNASGAIMRFRTSGSTGAPKACSHSLASLMQEMRAMAKVIGPVERIVSTVRSHHIYGFLFTVLLPHAMGRPELPLLDLQGRPPIGLDSLLRTGDLVVGFPEWWRAVGRVQPRLPGGIIGITSTAPCPDEVCEAVMATGLMRLLHIYGSSETSGVGWRDWPAQGYQLHPFWARVTGQDQALTRLLPDSTACKVKLQDQMTWLAPDRFQPGPRLDGAVQVGGVNVHLDQVRQRLLQQAGVMDLALRLHDFAGQSRLKAFVVPAPDAPANMAEQLRTWAARHLPPSARPVHYTLGAELPRNSMGKACDWDVSDAQRAS